MNRFYFSRLVTLAAILLGCNMSSFAQGVTSFIYTAPGGVQPYTVPPGCTQIAVDMAGGKGGDGNASGTGGKGGRVQCNVNVTPGQILYVYVGGAGVNYSTSTGGYNGGAQGGSNGGGGGGSSDISVNASTTITARSRLVVAGGGGGGGYNCSNMYGGDGGGLTGGNGYSCSGPTGGGTGGTQTGGGTGSTFSTPYGNAATDANGGTSNGNNYGGGGGGGYWGGGGGAYSGAGGGSSYTHPTQTSLVTHTMGYNASNGYVKITALAPVIISAVPTYDFGTIAVGAASVPQHTVLTGAYLVPATGTVTIAAPSGYEISYNGTSWSTSLTTSYSGSAIPGLGLFIRFVPGAPIPYNNNINITGGGLVLPSTIAVFGNGSTTDCSGAPTPGAAVVSPTSGGSGTVFALTLSGASTVKGLKYQWQSSSTGTAPWTNIVGAIRASHLVEGITATTYYRCVVTCSSGGSANSASVAATFTQGIYAKACSGIPSPGNSYASIMTGCSPFTTEIFEIGSPRDSGIRHQWQVSGDGLSFSNVSGATAPSLSQFINSTLYYRDMVTCSISGQSSYGPTLTATLNTPPDPIVGNTNICTALPSPFTSATFGGTWSSSNVGVASVDPSTGLVTGVGAGTAIISYSLSTGCYSSDIVTVSKSPSAISGSSKVCTGLTTALGNTLTGGTWSSSDVSKATVDASTGVATGIAVGQPVITYTVLSGCTAITTLTVDQQPAPISGANNVCAGSNTTLVQSIPGGVWTSTNSFEASVSPTSGFVTGILAGATPTISYTLPGGCAATIPMTVNALPGTILGDPTVCVGSMTTLSDAGGGTWASSNLSVATVDPMTGDVTGVAGGVVNIMYTLPVTGCVATKTMTVNTLPIVFNVTGGGGYCVTGGKHIGLSGSTPGVNYELYNGGTLASTVAGSSSGLDFGAITAVGTYTVQAVSATGCVSPMSGSANIFVNSLPADIPVSFAGGSGTYCRGGKGAEILVTGSETGVSYQLYLGSLASGPSIPGDGLPGDLSLGFTKPAGTYRIVATNTTTSCATTLTTMPTIAINNPPVIYPVSTSGGSAYCVGTAGARIIMASSDAGVTYDLYKTGTPTPKNSITSTGGSLDFGDWTTGTYTVKAMDGVGCISNMSGSINVTANPLPAIQTVTGGGSFCTGGAGVHIGVAYSIVNTTYQLNETTTGLVAGTIKAGASSGLDFGAINIPGTYNVIAKTAAGCTVAMAGTKTIVENMLPVAQSVGGGGGYCAGGSGAPVTLGTTENGFVYRLYRGTTLVKTLTGLGMSLNFGNQTNAGTYTATAYNPSTGCTANMSGSAVVTINPLPLAYKTFIAGSGAYCAGTTPSHIKLNGSETGTNYSLYLAGSPVASVVGTGDTLDFSAAIDHTTPGAYTVIAVSGLSCVNNMLGVANVTINPLPAPYTVSVTDGGNYCAGGAGVHVLLSGSARGINYQLFEGTTAVGAPLGGIGSGLDLGIQKTAGNYTVVAKNATTGCEADMTGTASINVIAPPVSYTLLGSVTNKYCPGGAGVDLQLSGSVPGFDYELFKGTTSVGVLSGTGSTLDFGFMPTGTYSVVAKDIVYTCTSTMAGNPTISNYPVPAAFAVTGGGSFCSTGTGVSVGLANCANGVKYQLFNGAAVGSDVLGSAGTAIDFGLQTAMGGYTVVATDTTTTCTNNMTGVATVTPVTPVTPAVSISAVRDTVCSGDAAVFTPKPINGGALPTYEWMVNGTTTATGSTFTYVPAKSDVVSATLTTSETCVTGTTGRSNDVSVWVKDRVTPTVTVNTATTTLCKSSTPVSFTATFTDPGTAPIFQWKKNGMAVGISSTSYSTVVNDSDVIFVVMKSNVECRTSDFVYSAPKAMTVNEVVVPQFDILAIPGTQVEKGTSVSFTALVSNPEAAGLTYTYKWSVRGVAVAGATNAVFTSNTLANDDIVSCEVTSKNACGTSIDARQLFMTIGTTGVKQAATASLDVTVVPNPNKGIFTVKGSTGLATDGEVTIQISNMLGQNIFSKNVAVANGVVNEQIMLNNNIANGMYLINIVSGTDHKVLHIVIEQ